MASYDVNKYFQNYKEQMDRIHAETAHDFHILEFQDMCKEMIAQALFEHDQQLDINVQTTLNGKPCTMNGLVSDIRKQLDAMIRKTFRK